MNIKNHPGKIVSIKAGRAIRELKREYNNDIDGWLSVADNSPLAGSLSLQNTEGGELSIKDDD